MRLNLRVIKIVYDAYRDIPGLDRSNFTNGTLSDLRRMQLPPGLKILHVPLYAKMSDIGDDEPMEIEAIANNTIKSLTLKREGDWLDAE